MIPTLLFSALLSSATAPASAQLQPAHQQVLNAWLQGHPGFRVAVETDCGDCSEQIQWIRRGGGGVWGPNPAYQPYRVIGDLNGDGHIDLAIAVINPGQSSNQFKILVFNGPILGSQSKKPAFVSEYLDLTSQGLFFGPPRPKPYRLVVGAFESEGILLVPKNNGYAWDLSSNE